MGGDLGTQVVGPHAGTDGTARTPERHILDGNEAAATSPI